MPSNNYRIARTHEHTPTYLYEFIQRDAAVIGVFSRDMSGGQQATLLHRDDDTPNTQKYGQRPPGTYPCYDTYKFGMQHSVTGDHGSTPSPTAPIHKT